MTENQSNHSRQPFAKKAAKLSLFLPLVMFAIGWLMQSFVPEPKSQELGLSQMRLSYKFNYAVITSRYRGYGIL